MSRSLLVLLVLATAGLAVALGIGAPDPGVAERSYAAAAGLLGIGALVRELGRPLTAGEGISPQHGAHLAEQEEIVDPALARLAELERSLRLGALTAGNFDLLVRRRLASLARTRGQTGTSGTAPARNAGLDLLGADGVLNPNNPRLADRSGPGISLEEVGRIVSSLEAPR